ncbi:MAG: beta-ketoacyl synthase N-terminal-like domain-containing protein, partial [Leptospirales bacterium]
MACRFPGGANSPEEYWKLLENKTDAIGPIPADRFNLEDYYDPTPRTPGKMYVREGGFIENFREFDPKFFGITPREAVSMDPQQRLLLEICYEAIENAGIPADSLKNSLSGVFVGMMFQDYLQHIIKFGKPENIDIYTGTGNVSSVAVGRISYTLGFQGPCVAVDTACSASLVAIHLAVQSLRSGESNMALAGGVNILLSPEMYCSLSWGGTLAPDARCKTFDSRANGYVRSEGCGILVLKRLSDAVADGDRVLSVIRGSSSNHGGPTSGLTVPNGVAQRDLLQQALRNADLKSDQVDYIEAHGTGTPQGDPIEVNAIQSALGKGRSPDRVLTLGSVKTNLGHMETAAGVGGAMKVVLSLQHQKIPSNLHFKELNPGIDLQSIPARIASDAIEWPRGDAARVGGVSSFGLSGINAHVLFEEAPVAADEPGEARNESSPGDAARSKGAQYILPLSAETVPALRDLARSYARFLKDPDLLGETPIAQVCYAATFHRARHAQTLTISCETREDLIEKLEAFADEQERSGMAVREYHRDARRKLVFVASGQGPKFWPIDPDLLENEPVFRETLERCDAILQELAGWSLMEQLSNDDESKDTRYTQPCLTAIQIALFELWKSWGVVPDAVVGHSMGEVPAAYMAGVLSLEDAMRVIFHRGRLIQTLCDGRGGMAFVELTPDQADEELRGHESVLSVAASNSPGNVVLSGETKALDEMLKKLEARDVFVKKLESVEFASHSPQMEEIQADFAQAIQGIRPRKGDCAFYSTVFAAKKDGEALGPDYWSENIRKPVLFSKSVANLLEAGYNTFIEIAPHPALSVSVKQCVAAADKSESAAVLYSLHRKEAKLPVIYGSLGELYGMGHPFDLRQFYPNEYRYVRLPNYPWQRATYWIEEQSQRSFGGARSESFDSRSLGDSGAKYAAMQAMNVPAEMNIENYGAQMGALARLTVEYLVDGLAQLGAFGRAGEAYSVNSFLDKFGIKKEHSKLIGRWFVMLEGEGILTATGDSYKNKQPLRETRKQSLIAEARPLFHDAPYLLDYVINSGENLIGILTEATSPLEVLFPGGSTELADNLYGNWSVARYFNSILRAALQGLLAELPRDARLRVLEAGAGTGGTAATLLPALPAHRTEYAYTDVSNFFFDRVQDKFAGYEFLDYRVLDLDQAAGTQGFEPESFDIILCSNVLHACHNVETAAENIFSLLAPGGFVFVYEITEMLPWFNITTGLLDAWQRFDDSKRETIPLMPMGEWRNLLRAAGFEALGVWPDNGALAAKLGQHALLFQKPETAGRSRAFGGRPGTADAVASLRPEDSWSYDLSWLKQSPAGETPAAITGETVVVFCDAGGVGAELAAQLERKDNQVIRVFSGDRLERVDTGEYRVDPRDGEQFRRMLDEALSTIVRPLHHVVYLWGVDCPDTPLLDSEQLEHWLDHTTGGLLHLSQALAGGSGVGRIWIGTRGLYQLPGDEHTIQAAQAPLCGMGRTLSLEHPELWGGTIDLDPAAEVGASARAIQNEMASYYSGAATDAHEDQIALRGEERFVARLEALQAPATGEDAFALDEHKTYLITGGLGNLG